MTSPPPSLSKWADVRFTFPAPKILFGRGVSEELPKAIFELLDPMIIHLKKAVIESPKAMIVIGSQSVRKSGALDRILEACERNAIQTVIFECGSGEATTKMVQDGVEFAIKENPHYIVGIGGGSVLDVAKAIAGIAVNGGIPQDYYDGKPFELPGIPFIAIPTTAGTGAELSNNAVLIDLDRQFKQSIRGNQLTAKYILLDPELTMSCAVDVTISSGIDALVQAIEAYVSRRHHPIADIFAREAIQLIATKIKHVVDHGDDYDARSEMMLGSFFSGIAFSNAGLGLVHGFAHPIGFKYKIPHGKLCGTLLPPIIEYNLTVCAERYAELATFLNQLDLFTRYEPNASHEENARRLAGMIKELLNQLQIPIHLRDYGVLKEDFNWIIANTKGGSVNNNPRDSNPELLREILEKAW